MECTTCGKPATMLWAAIDMDQRSNTHLAISSINGFGRMSPSCNECGGTVLGVIAVRVPIYEIEEQG